MFFLGDESFSSANNYRLNTTENIEVKYKDYF